MGLRLAFGIAAVSPAACILELARGSMVRDR